MFLVPVNYLSVLICGIASMILGFLWYGPIFGKQWMGLVGMTKEKMEKAKGDMSKTYGIMFVSALVMAWVLEHFIWYAAPGSVTLTIGIKTGIWAWLGLVATTMLNGYLFSPEKKPWMLYAIDSGYYLVLLSVMGAIIASM